MGDGPRAEPVVLSAARRRRITGAQLRAAMRLLPTSVAVVAAGCGGEPHGLTIGSLFGLSLDPPMIGFCVRRESASWPRIAEAGRFRASVLAAGQAGVGRALARSGGAKFDAVAWSWSDHGNPRVEGALLGVECALDTQLVVGDHYLVTARVEDLHPAAGDPLIYFQRFYRTIAAEP
jgi:flavin reductase (DIM6/NTAB) family NADH-FMN oxidoreductase RutF